MSHPIDFGPDQLPTPDDDDDQFFSVDQYGRSWCCRCFHRIMFYKGGSPREHNCQPGIPRRRKRSSGRSVGRRLDEGFRLIAQAQ